MHIVEHQFELLVDMGINVVFSAKNGCYLYEFMGYFHSTNEIHIYWVSEPRTYTQIHNCEFDVFLIDSMNVSLRKVIS